jgi:hypothetical protein
MTERMNLDQYHRQKKRGRNKYGNQITESNGRKFRSKLEAGRNSELEALERAGLIRDLRRQVPYHLEVNGVRITRYDADFVYFDTATGNETVEDTKGFETEYYKIKRALMLALNGIAIVEIRSQEKTRCRLKTLPKSKRKKQPR